MPNNTKQKTTSIDTLLNDLRRDSEYRKAERLVGPYYELAVEIINLRNKLGLTQTELAERVGTFQSRISKIESGEHDVRLSTLIGIAEALDSQVSIKMIRFADTVIQSDARRYTTVLEARTVGVQPTVPSFAHVEYRGNSKLVAIMQS